MLLPIKDMAGKQLGELEVSDAVFAAPVNKSLMHQALVRQLANARLGNHSTKTRGQVRGGGRKPWRQKGTGRARSGSTRSPNWVGGGTVFGPTPRSYDKGHAAQDATSCAAQRSLGQGCRRADRCDGRFPDGIAQDQGNAGRGGCIGRQWTDHSVRAG